MNFNHRLVGVLLTAALAGLSGCGDSTRATVSGNVTVDGKPLESGAINFLPTGATKGPSAGATIVEGRYLISTEKGVQIGENLVQIRGVGKTGKMVANPMGPGQIEEWAEHVPEKYNKRTTLSRAVKAGSNELDFELTSK
jgi:hypothetical protein